VCTGACSRLESKLLKCQPAGAGVDLVKLVTGRCRIVGWLPSASSCRNPRVVTCQLYID
jgi:hypothetical protein